MRFLVYILLFTSLCQGQSLEILEQLRQQQQSGIDYSIGSATCDNKYDPTPDVRSLEVANSKAFMGWGDSIYQFSYDESDITNWSDDSNTGTGYLSSHEVRWSPDGLNMALSQGDKRIFNYVITTAYDPTARSTRTEQDFSSQVTSAIRTFYTKPDGTKLYVADQTANTIYQYSLSTAGVVTSASYDSKSLTVNAETDYIAAICISPDGKYLLVGDPDDDEITEYEMSTPWDISTATQNTGNSLSIGTNIALVYGIRYKPDGTGIWVIDYLGSEVGQWDLNN